MAVRTVDKVVGVDLDKHIKPVDEHKKLGQQLRKNQKPP
jgi:hypothetical protein